MKWGCELTSEEPGAGKPHAGVCGRRGAATPPSTRKRSIRPFAVGRNNWLFSYSAKGAKASAVSYSIVETALANGLVPFLYIKFLLETLPNIPPQQYHTCLPWSPIVQERCRIPVPNNWLFQQSLSPAGLPAGFFCIVDIVSYLFWLCNVPCYLTFTKWWGAWYPFQPEWILFCIRYKLPQCWANIQGSAWNEAFSKSRKLYCYRYERIW